ncbi:MAG: TetR/AcrR family transcriptional regulator [Eubacteriales bacterium]
MARTQEQNKKIKEDRKAQILKEALHQFSTKGLFATKISDIAEAVGMSQGLMYHYYKSKEEVYTELVNNALDKLNEAVFALRKMPIPAHEKISRTIEGLLYTMETSDDFIQTCRLIAQATNSTAIPNEAKKLIEEKRDIPYKEIAKIITVGQSEGTIVEADPNELSLIFWSFLNGLSIYKDASKKEVKMPDAKVVINMFLKENYDI